MSGTKEYTNHNVAQNRGLVEEHIKEILRLIGEDPEREG